MRRTKCSLITANSDRSSSNAAFSGFSRNLYFIQICKPLNPLLLNRTFGIKVKEGFLIKDHSIDSRLRYIIPEYLNSRRHLNIGVCMNSKKRHLHRKDSFSNSANNLKMNL